MKLEYKEIEIQGIKEVSEQGTFEGLASPFNNIDLGNDRVLPSVGTKNDGKKVPLLYQHDTHQPIGEMILKNSEEGVKCEAQFFIDKDDDKNYLIPKAAEAYLLAKKGILKLSIGYQTKEYEYVKEGTKTIRNLKDIDIKEVSCVTFPMNTDAKITNVKEEGKEENKTEVKAQGFNEKIKLRQNRELLYQLRDALGDIFFEILREEGTQVAEKINAMNAAIDEFAGQYKQVTSDILNASSTAQKDIIEDIEKKNTSKSIEDVKNVKEHKEENQENEAKINIKSEGNIDDAELAKELKNILENFNFKGVV